MAQKYMEFKMAQKYRVTTKDNPLTLSKKFGVSPQKLLQTNGLKTLTAGQTIKIPTFGQVGGGIYDPSNPNAGNPFFRPNDMTGQMAVSGSSTPVNFIQPNSLPRTGGGLGRSASGGNLIRPPTD